MVKKNILICYIIVLIILIIFCKSILTIKSIKYKINKKNEEISIEESINGGIYNIILKNNKEVIPIYVSNIFNGKKKIISDIYYYKDNKYTCMFPLFNNRQVIDVKCINKNIIYNYHEIIGTDSKLDTFIKSIKEYNPSQYEDKIEISSKINNIDMYNSINRTVSITTYNGIIVDGKYIKLFDNDVYANKLGVYIDKYYLIADYSEKYEFNKFKVVDLDKKEVFEIMLRESISFDSYIQGTVDGKVYLYDKDNKIQYEIDISNKKIKIISDEKYIKYYKNSKWEKMSKSKLRDEQVFKNIYYDKFDDYNIVNETNINYFVMPKIKNSNKLYKINKSNISVYNYLLNIPVKQIYFNDEYIYYVDKNILYYYSEETGLKSILNHPELEFNSTIKYYIY